MYKYIVKNREKMIKGEVSHTINAGGVGICDFLAEGRPPFKKFAWPTNRTLVSNEGLLGFYVTMDPNIKSLKDLAGKRVGTAERSRPFLGVLLDKPLFTELGIFKQVKWAPLGDMGCKDAFLNGKLDATRVSFGGKIEIAEDGSFYFRRIAPSPSTMEILNSGKKLYWLPVGKEWIEKGYDYSKDVISYPCVIKKGALKMFDRDIQARAGAMRLRQVSCGAGILPGYPISDRQPEEIRASRRHQGHEEAGISHSQGEVLIGRPGFAKGQLRRGRARVR